MKNLVPENIQKLEKTYLLHTEYHCFPGGRKKLGALMGLLEEMKRTRSLRVLDVGCGNGSISFPVASLGHEVLGVDISAEAVEEVRRKNGFIFARFECRDITARPLGEQFDCIVCSEVLEHLTDPGPLLLALNACLKSDGKIFVTVPNGYGLREVLGRMERVLRSNPKVAGLLERVRRVLRMRSEEEKHRMHTNNPDQEHVQKFTPQSLGGYLERAGFEVESWSSSFVFLSLFGDAKNGVGFGAELDSWLADALPRACASGWYVVCRKKASAAQPCPVK